MRIGDQFINHLSCKAADLIARLTDCRQRRRTDSTEHGVIKSHNSKLVRDHNMLLVSGLNDSGSDNI